ncbi:MAG: hypothetical protein ACYDDF_02780 [Thermoplasmatota archaeon]
MRAPRWTRAAVGFIVLILGTSHAVAQVPTTQQVDLQVGLSTATANGHLMIPPGQQVFVPITVTDTSVDGRGSVTNPYKHVTEVTAHIESNDSLVGWQVSVVNGTVFTSAGSTGVATLIVQALYSAQTVVVTVNVSAVMTDQTGHVATGNLGLTAQLLPYYGGQSFVLSQPAWLSQNEVTTYEIKVTNQATYPDWFDFDTNATAGFVANFPSRIYVPPLSDRVLNMTIQAPITSLYDLGTLGIIFLHERSVSDPAFQYTLTAIVGVRGFFVGDWWTPTALFSLTALAFVGRTATIQLGDRRNRRGKPRRPRPSARQAVLLKETKKVEPTLYKEKVAIFDAIYRERRGIYAVARKQLRREERAQRKAQRTEEKAERAASKAERQRTRLDERRARRERRKAAKIVARKTKQLAALREQADKMRQRADETRLKAERRRMEQRRAELEKTADARRKELKKLRKQAEKASKREEADKNR